MLLSTVNPEAAEAIGTIKKVGVGNIVVYHGRAGMMRQGRTEFPAIVMRQYEDDGSLELLVLMESEDMITESRVQFQSHNQPHHCWSVVEDVPGTVPAAERLGNAVFGDFVEGTPGLKDQVAQLSERIAALEAKRGPGRPAKPKAA